MTDTMTSQNTELSFWDTLCKATTSAQFYKNGCNIFDKTTDKYTEADIAV
jgi:hypothetical protein